MSLPKRKGIRLKDYDYNQNGAYFLTVCVKNRRNLLGNIDVGDAVPSVPNVRLSAAGICVKECLAKMNDVLDCAVLENYVIMPNRLHLLIVVNQTSGTLRTASPTKALLPRIIHGLKASTTKQLGSSIWQRAYHDHIIRSEKEFEIISQYIDDNPAKWAEDKYYCNEGAA